MIGRGSGRASRCSGDGGVAVVEAAILAPVLLLLVFGVFEFGLLFRNWLSTADAVGDGVRMGAIFGPTRLPVDTVDMGEIRVTGDYAIVAKIREGTASIPATKIERIVIFRARPAGFGSALDQVPQACKTSPVSLGGAIRCNVYPADEAFYALQAPTDPDYFICPEGGGTRACGWPPQDRLDGPDAFEIDYIGVYVRFQHDWVTGLFGQGFGLERAAIARIEPGSTE